MREDIGTAIIEPDTMPVKFSKGDVLSLSMLHLSRAAKGI
jgi:hypothetical protein